MTQIMVMQAPGHYDPGNTHWQPSSHASNLKLGLGCTLCWIRRPGPVRSGQWNGASRCFSRHGLRRIRPAAGPSVLTDLSESDSQTWARFRAGPMSPGPVGLRLELPGEGAAPGRPRRRRRMQARAPGGRAPECPRQHAETGTRREGRGGGKVCVWGAWSGRTGLPPCACESGGGMAGGKRGR